MGRILNRYLFVEILVPFFLGLAVFTFVLLIARILKLVELVVNRGVPLLDIVETFALILPGFLEVTVPMALLLAILLGFGRLASDSEVVALKTSGVSLYQMTVPVVAFTVLASLATFVIAIWVRPWANGALREQLFEVVKSRVSAGFKEKVFNTIIPRNVRLGEAPSHGMPGVLYDTKSRGAAAYIALAREMLSRHGDRAA